MGRIYKGESISAGVAEGIALVTGQALAFFHTEVATGKILYRKHELYGEIAKDKILVIPSMSANIDMWKFYWCWREGTAPRAIVTGDADDYIIAASNLAEVPCVHRIGEDPTKVIMSGQTVKVDGDQGTVEVIV